MTFKDKRGKKSFQNWSARALLEHPISPKLHGNHSAIQRTVKTCVLAVKDTKAINQSPSVQSSSSSKLPPSSGLDLLVHADHLLTIQSLWSARVLQMICSWDWEEIVRNLLKWLCPFWNLTSTLWHLEKQPVFSLSDVIFSPLANFLQVKAEWRNAIYFWLNE